MFTEIGTFNCLRNYEILFFQKKVGNTINNYIFLKYKKLDLKITQVRRLKNK